MVTLVRLVQFSKAWSLIAFTLLGIVTLVRDVHLWNIPDGIVLIPSFIVTDRSAEHPANAPCGTHRSALSVQVPSMTTDVSCVQFAKAAGHMSATLRGIDTLSKPLSAKAP